MIVAEWSSVPFVAAVARHSVSHLLAFLHVADDLQDVLDRSLFPNTVHMKYFLVITSTSSLTLQCVNHFAILVLAQPRATFTARQFLLQERVLSSQRTVQADGRAEMQMIRDHLKFGRPV